MDKPSSLYLNWREYMKEFKLDFILAQIEFVKDESIRSNCSDGVVACSIIANYFTKKQVGGVVTLNAKHITNCSALSHASGANGLRQFYSNKAVDMQLKYTVWFLDKERRSEDLYYIDGYLPAMFVLHQDGSEFSKEWMYCLYEKLTDVEKTVAGDFFPALFKAKENENSTLTYIKQFELDTAEPNTFYLAYRLFCYKQCNPYEGLAEFALHHRKHYLKDFDAINLLFGEKAHGFLMGEYLQYGMPPKDIQEEFISKFCDALKGHPKRLKIWQDLLTKAKSDIALLATIRSFQQAILTPKEIKMTEHISDVGVQIMKHEMLPLHEKQKTNKLK